MIELPPQNAILRDRLRDQAGFDQAARRLQSKHLFCQRLFHRPQPRAGDPRAIPDFASRPRRFVIMVQVVMRESPSLGSVLMPGFEQQGTAQRDNSQFVFAL